MKTKRKIKLNLWQQVTIGIIALILLTILAMWQVDNVFGAAQKAGQPWFAITVWGYLAVGGLLSGGIVYGLWWLGDHDV